MNNILLVTILSLTTAAFAQQAGKQTPPPAKPVSVAKPEASSTMSLEKRIVGLEKEIKTLQESNAWLLNYVFEQVGKLQHPTASFDPSSPGPFQQIDSGIGPLLISLGKAEQYLDGYNVQLEIGNTTAATLHGIKVSAKWAKRYKQEDGNYLDWYNARKTKDFSFTGTLVSGRWNIFQMILPDTKPTEFGYLEVSIETNTVSMAKLPVSQ